MIGAGRDRDRGCARAREWASLRLDGEVSEIERLLLRRHLSRCVECRSFAASLVTATAVVRATPPERPSRPLEPEPEPAQRRLRLRPRLAAAYGLVVVVAGIGALVGGLIASGGEAPAPVRPQPTEISLLPTLPNVTPARPATTPLEPPGENV